MVRMSDLRRSQRSAGSMDCENGKYLSEWNLPIYCYSKLTALHQ